VIEQLLMSIYYQLDRKKNPISEKVVFIDPESKIGKKQMDYYLSCK